jgi:hypothetical protein
VRLCRDRKNTLRIDRLPKGSNLGKTVLF